MTNDNDVYLRPAGSMTLDELRTNIRSAVGEYGTQKEAGLAWGISNQYISDIVSGRKLPGKKALNAWRLRKVTYYAHK